MRIRPSVVRITTCEACIVHRMCWALLMCVTATHLFTAALSTCSVRSMAEYRISKWVVGSCGTSQLSPSCTSMLNCILYSMSVEVAPCSDALTL